MQQSAADGGSLAAPCQRVIEKIERASSLHARDLQASIDDISRVLVELRDRLIDRLRTSEAPAQRQYRRALDGVNVAMSLVIGVGYPVTSVQRKHLEHARSTLAEVATQISS
jgi:hypothetical protein